MGIKFPLHKSDIDTVQDIIRLNPLEHTEFAGALLEWCYDPNWPVAYELSIWLAKMGRRLLPVIHELEKIEDHNAKYSIIYIVISHVPKSERIYFLPVLMKWAYHPTKEEKAEEVDQAAVDVLTRWLSGQMSVVE